MAEEKTHIDRSEYLNEEINRFTTPPVAPKPTTLPLTSLDWKTFEHLCVRLVVRESSSEADQVHLWGVQGDNQAGIDIYAPKYINGTKKIWCYQCKNYKYFSPGEFEKAITDLKEEAEHYVFFLACEAQVSLRDIEKNYDHVTLLDQNDISRKLETMPDLVAKFFHEGWVDVFCTTIANGHNLPEYTITGKIFAPYMGDPIRGAQVIINGSNDRAVFSDETGRFSCVLHEIVPHVEIIAFFRSSEDNASYSRLVTFTWEEAVDNDVEIRLQAEEVVKGKLLWQGTNKPITSATLNVEINGNVIRSFEVNRDGTFSVNIPQRDGYLTLTAENTAMVKYSFTWDYFRGKEIFDGIYLASKCRNVDQSQYYLQTICQGLEICFSTVNAGSYITGLNNESSNLEYNLYVSKYPITCLEYSVFLQHIEASANDDVIPRGWNSVVAPIDKVDHPVTGISLKQANLFCNWLKEITDVDFRLLTTHEWEIAARGPQGWKYPWGNQENNAELYCNIISSTTSPVDQYNLGKSAFGVWDMLGNVAEWTCTKIIEGKRIDNKMLEDVESNDTYIVRGGSYFSSPKEVSCHTEDTYVANSSNPFTGFRIAFQVKGE